MWLWMSSVHPTALQPLPYKLIVKNGDDLRQDMLTLQMLTLFDKVSMNTVLIKDLHNDKYINRSGKRMVWICVLFHMGV